MKIKKNTKILITGGSGYIGSVWRHFCQGIMKYLLLIK